MNLLRQFRTWAHDLTALSESLRHAGAIEDSCEVQEQVHSYERLLDTASSTEVSTTELSTAATSVSAGLNRRSIDLLQNCCVETTAHGIIKRANQAASKLLNLSLPFLSGQPLLVFVHHGDRRAFLAEFMVLRKSQRAHDQWLVKCQPLFDAPCLALFTTQRVTAPDGRTAGFIWLLTKHHD